MKIIPLSEGSFTVDRTKAFVPFDKDKDLLQDRPTGSLLVEIQPFLVQTKEHNILLDTGLGFSNSSGQMQVHENLARYDIKAEDISMILMSHLHKDHAGGIADDNGQLSFPNADYYIHSSELNFAMDKENKSYIRTDFEMLAGSPKLKLLDGDEGTIAGIIEFELTGGHCPYHVAYHIKEDSEHIFFGGDVAPQLQQMKNRFIAKYDFNGKKAMELRQEWWDKGLKQGWTFLFYHDIRTPKFQ